MAQQNGTVLETQIGLVEAINAQGIKVAGRWWNFSRYHEVPRPSVGQQVVLEAKGGFIQKLTIRVQAESAEPKEDRVSAASESASLEERRSARLAVLRAAASFLALRPDATSTDVLKVAERWVGWVLHDPVGQPGHEV